MKKALLISESSVYRDKSGKITARGGGEVCFHNIAKSLIKIGIVPTVFAIREFEGQVEEEKIEGVLYKRVKVHSRSSFKIVSYLRKAVKQSKDYDYVFVNQFSPHLVLPWLKGKKVGVIHDVYRLSGKKFWYKQYGFLRGLMGNFIERLQLRFDRRYTDKIMTVSDFSEDKILSVMGDRVVRKIVKNPYPIHIDEYNSKMKKENFLLFVGRFVDYKHPEHVLHVLREIKPLFPDFKAVFVAARVENPCLKRFQKVRKELGLNEEDIILKRNCDSEEVKDLFSRAKVFIQPSYMEGQGIVILESLASGTPVLAYDLPAYSGMIRKNKNSVLAEKGKIGKLSKGLIEILNNYEKFHKNCGVSPADFSEKRFLEQMRKICN
ncbi:glycosyltransferase [Candidatus Peregrinibacteria bacterium]|nr:glycosyltransferase [Candidatus Peregrinibacteria bacterium]